MDRDDEEAPAGEKIKYEDIKRRARKGIPDSIRGSAWPILANSNEFIPTQYTKTFQGKQAWMKTLLNKPLPKKTLQDIFKDITRTLPKHVYFKEDLGTGQKSLFAVLKCLANQFEECGYVQGMGFLSGMLMTHVTPEDCFCMVNCFYLKPDYNVKPLYMKGMPGLEVCFYILLSLMKKYICADLLGC